MHYLFEIIDAYSKHSNVLFSLTLKQENPKCFTRVMRCFSCVVLFHTNMTATTTFSFALRHFFRRSY